MIETIGKLIPLEAFGPVLLAGVVWGGANYLAIGPEVGARMGAITYQPVCVADVETMQRRFRTEYEQERKLLQAQADRAREAARHAAEVARQQTALVEGLARTFVPLELRQGPAGEVVGLLMGALAPPVPPAPEIPEVPTVPPPLEAPEPETREAFCRCVIDRTVDGMRTDLALYTGSLTLHTPAPVRHFKAGMASVARSDACGSIQLS